MNICLINSIYNVKLLESVLGFCQINRYEFMVIFRFCYGTKTNYSHSKFSANIFYKKNIKKYELSTALILNSNIIQIQAFLILVTQ
jgi:hypothetical protein